MNIEALIGFLNSLVAFFSKPEVGAAASVIGALISARVWFSLGEMRRKVLFRQRAPESVAEIRNHASAIDVFLQDFEVSAEGIDTEVALSLETLNAVLSKLSGPAKDSTKSAIAVIKIFRESKDGARTRLAVRNVYTHLLSAALAIENMVADAKQEL